MAKDWNLEDRKENLLYVPWRELCSFLCEYIFCLPLHSCLRSTNRVSSSNIHILPRGQWDTAMHPRHERLGIYSPHLLGLSWWKPQETPYLPTSIVFAIESSMSFLLSKEFAWLTLAYSIPLQRDWFRNGPGTHGWSLTLGREVDWCLIPRKRHKKSGLFH